MDNCSLSEAHPTEICKLLTNKTAAEKAQIKSCEIARRDFKGEYTNTQYGVRVEIIGEVKEINVNGQSGIELFAKAWRGDKQLGFGKDGSVEIERFRIFNPPILVDDPNGTIIKEWIDKQGQTRQRKLQENPIEAIKQVIAHNVKLVGKENANIIMGKIGNTTDTFYADAGDALVRKSDTNFATARNAAGADAVHSTSAVGYPSVGLEAGTTYNFYIAFHMFDTSAIAATDTIDSATYSFFLGGDNGGTAGNQWAITQSTQTTWNSLSGGDYGKRGSTEGATRQNRKVAAETGYQDFALNATGLTWVARSGETKPASASASGKTQLVMAWAKDLDNSAPTTNDYNDVRFADQTGTANDPKLVVVHSAAVVVTPTPTPTPSDTTAPSGSVNINSGASYTNSSTVTLTLSATDATGVTGYYLSDSSSTPSASASGWTSVTSTTSYSASVSYSLSGGEGGKTIYVWYTDAAGNISSAASATITYDTTVPTVTISSPTSSSTYTSTSSTISLGGSASDSSSGISSVTWSNSKGGNGTVTGTASWTVSSISLSSGDNVITVTAKDGANNSGTDTLQVTYSTSSTVSAPTVSTGSASNVTTSSATLNGTVNANGGTTTAWFQYGTTSGSYGNTSSTQAVTGSSNTTVSIGISGLSSGTNYYYRIAAQNSAGTSYGSESSVTTTSAATPTPTPSTGDTTAPTVTITSPTSSSTYTTTSSTITLSGTASDNSGSVSTVTWSNSKGGSGTASGTASGTTSWTISSISLSVGDNVITVTATDGSGNFGTDTITVTYNVTSTPTPTAVPTATTTPKPKPSPTAQPTPTRPPTLPPLPTPQVSPSPINEGIVFGFVNDEDELPLEGVTVTIVGANGRSPLQNSTETDENGYYEFSGLVNGDYTLTYKKEGFLAQTLDVSLEEGELKDLGTVTMEQAVSGKIYGYVVNIKGDPIEFVRLKLRGIKTKVTNNASSDADGFFEFADLEADTYVIVARKKKYRNTQQKVKLEEGASEEIEIVMKKTSKRIKGLLLEDDVQ